MILGLSSLSPCSSPHVFSLLSDVSLLKKKRRRRRRRNLNRRIEALVQSGRPLRGLFALSWRRLILDEASYVKNPATGNAAILTLLRADCRLFLTATPVPNSRARELNSLLRGLGCTLRLEEQGNKEGDEEEEEADSGDSDEEQGIHSDGIEMGDEDEPLENAEIRRLIFERLVVASYSNEDSSPTGRILLPEVRRLPLHPLDMAEYNAFRDHLEVTERHPFLRDHLKRKFCLSPALACNDEDLLANPDRPTPPRMLQVIGYVHEEMRDDEKLLVHAKWTTALQELGFHLSRAGISNAFIHGKTSLTQMTEILNDFKREDGGPRVLLMSDVSKFGTNGLQRANHVIELQPDYVPGEDDQVGGRINRLGQTRLTRMCFIKFVWLNTIEMDVERKNADKRKRLRDFYSGGGAGNGE
jgi:SNF2 family DNA or RNA helicase